MKPIALINGILANASEDYKARVPQVTQNNIAEVGAEIYSNSALRNEFIEALTNKIAKTYVEIRSYENPLRALKRGKIDVGDTVEEIFIALCKAENFDAEQFEAEAFKRVKPIVLSAFHSVNARETYTQTIDRSTLKKAFRSVADFERTINGIIDNMYTSKELDEFLKMKSLINTAGVSGYLAVREIPAPVDEATTKQAMAVIKKTMNDMKFMKTDFNQAGVQTHTPKKNQVILIDTDFDARVDVELLAQAFNMSKTDFESRKIVVDDFGGLDDVRAMLIDEKWFLVEDDEEFTDSQKNAKGRYVNWYLHNDNVFSISPFANAVVFPTVAPVLTAIDVTRTDGKTTYGAGEVFALQVVATGTTDYLPTAVTYTVDNANDSDTRVLPNGLVIIGKNEDVATLNITATSKYDGAITDTIALTLA